MVIFHSYVSLPEGMVIRCMYVCYYLWTSCASFWENHVYYQTMVVMCHVWIGCFFDFSMFWVWAPRGAQRFPHFFNIPSITADPGCGVGVGWGGVGVITSCTLAYYMTWYAVLRSCALAAHMYCHAGYVANTSASGVGLGWGGVGVITSCTLA